MLLLPTLPKRLSLINILQHLLTINNDFIHCGKLIDLILLNPNNDNISETTIPIEFKLVQLLIRHKIIDKSHEILKKIPFHTLVNYAQTPPKADQVLNAFLYSNLPKQCIKFIIDKKSNKIYNNENLVQKKIDLAKAMLFKGYRQEAIFLIDTLKSNQLNQPFQLASLLAINVNLLRFEKIDIIVSKAKKKIIHPSLYIHLSMYHVCSGNYEKAKAVIEQHEETYDKNYANIMYKTMILNLQSHHVEALEHIKTLISRKWAETCDLKYRVYMEKADALRCLGKLEDALHYYKKAQKLETSYEVNLWIAHFEEAATLIYLNRNEDALNTLQIGCDINSIRFNADFNPCIVLCQFLTDFKQGFNTNINTIQFQKMITNTMLWPFPFIPMREWTLLIISLLAIKHKNYAVASRSIMHVYDNRCFHLKYKELHKHYNAVSENKNILEYRIHFHFIKSLLFPNNFFWNVFYKLNSLTI